MAELYQVPVIAGLAVGAGVIVLFSLFFGSASTPTPTDLENAIITMERTVCFGVCPEYSLTIYGNGTIVYEGRSFVAVTGRQTAMVPREDVGELVDHFYAISYFSLKDEYAAPVTDLPTTTTSIRIDGHFKKVINYYGAPENLRALEDRIDEIAGSETWVKCQEGQRLSLGEKGGCVSLAERVWYSIHPLQCRIYPWVADYQNSSATVPYHQLTTEERLAVLMNYYSNQGIEVFDARFDIYSDVVCEACSCGTGYDIQLLIVEDEIAKIENDISDNTIVQR